MCNITVFTEVSPFMLVLNSASSQKELLEKVLPTQFFCLGTALRLASSVISFELQEQL